MIKFPWMEIFRAGTHTDANGKTDTYTEDDVQKIADTYNAAVKEDSSLDAPVVKGHPKTEDKAFGWIEKLKTDGASLLAKVKDMPEEFKKQIEDGEFKKRSIALTKDMRLRHVGFLGAVAPAVEGMEPISFNDDEFTEYESEYAEAPEDTIAERERQQAARAKLYGIGVKDKIGYLKKPDAYDAISDDSFADPVNFLYPIDSKANLIASKSSFNGWDHNYTDIERQIIYARFITAADTLGIDYEANLYFAGEKDAEGNVIEFNAPTGKPTDPPPSEFAIALRKEWLKDRTGVFATYRKDNFADSVHKRFPLKTRSDTLASLAVFSKTTINDKYSQGERQEIVARLVTACDKHSIKRRPENWIYSEGDIIKIKIDNLSRNQLIDYIKGIFATNTKGTSMDNFVTEVVKWLAENATEELATSFQAFADEYKAANPESGGADPAPEENPELAAANLRIRELEMIGRNANFNSYLDTLSNKLPKTLREQAFNLLTQAEENQDLAYSATTEGDEVGKVKAFLDGLPNLVSKTEFAGRGNAGSGSQAAEATITMPDEEGFEVQESSLHNEVLAYCAKQKEAGNIISYMEGLSIVESGI